MIKLTVRGKKKKKLWFVVKYFLIINRDWCRLIAITKRKSPGFLQTQAIHKVNVTIKYKTYIPTMAQCFMGLNVKCNHQPLHTMIYRFPCFIVLTHIQFIYLSMHIHIYICKYPSYSCNIASGCISVYEQDCKSHERLCRIVNCFVASLPPD